jgi:hypothetical protein
MLTHTIAALTCVATLFAAAQEPEKLKVGSAMPSLENVQVMQGSKDGLADAKVVVVEFWATWCGPCVKAIPHINQIAKDNGWRGLQVLGVSTDSSEDKGKVDPFIKKMGSRMTYNVGWAGEGISRGWMEASGQKGIPTAFVCTNGKIAWIGNPMDDGFETAIRKCLSGRFDPELSPKGEQYLEAGRNAAKKKNWREASKHFDDCIALKPEIFVDAMEAKYTMLADQQKDAAAAKSWAAEVAGKLSSSPVALAEFAVFVAQDPRLQQHDLESAQIMIEGAMASGGSKVDVLVCAARVAASSGKFDEAVDLQNKARRQATPEQKPFLKTDLDAYKQSQAKGAAAKVGQ